MNKILSPNYKKFYQLYKKMPAIAAITTMILALVWSIIDVIVFRVGRGGWFTSVWEFGILRLNNPIVSILIWLAIGVVLATIVWFFSALTISATITRTDAVLEISEKNN
jgi:Zn-dependent protease with chaperone function